MKNIEDPIVTIIKETAHLLRVGRHDEAIIASNILRNIVMSLKTLSDISNESHNGEVEE